MGFDAHPKGVTLFDWVYFVLVVQLCFRLIVKLNSSRGFDHACELAKHVQHNFVVPHLPYLYKVLGDFMEGQGKLTQTYGPWFDSCLIWSLFPLDITSPLGRRPFGIQDGEPR